MDIPLRLVQPNIAQSHKWRDDLRAQHFLRHLDMTRAAIAAAKAEPGGKTPAVIWAETAAPYFLGRETLARIRIAEVLPPDGLVITGAPRATPPDEPFRVWNSVEAVDARGRIAATYDKTHLVPFGEYLPFRDVLAGWFNLEKITTGAVDFSAGPGPRTIDLPGLPPVSPLICYEAIFPGDVTEPGRRPAWLLNVTNDAWFGLSSGPYQHFEAARLRAVEEGLPLVRVANTGISGIVDSLGRVQAELGLGRSGVVAGMLPAARDATPYAHFGDGAAAVLVVFSCLLAALLGRRAASYPTG